MATAFLITQAVQRSIAGFAVGASLFTASMVLLYLTSTLYHAFPAGKTKRVRQIIEHSATFLLIAGTYTPFTLGVLRGTWGWTILGLVWGLAVVGVVLKALNGLFHPLISTGLYLLMGWLILIAIHPLVTTVPLEGLFWIGGVADKIRPLHLALVRNCWHRMPLLRRPLVCGLSGEGRSYERVVTFLEAGAGFPIQSF